MKKMPFYLLIFALLTAPVFYSCGDDDDDDTTGVSDDDDTTACDDHETETDCDAGEDCEWVLYSPATTADPETGDDFCQDKSAAPTITMSGEQCTDATKEADCGAGLCLTADVMAGLLEDFPADAVIEDGYCSKLMCAGDEECGPNGKCLDITTFVGQEIMVCLLACDAADVCETCRDSENYRCYTRDGFDDSACLPVDLIKAIETDVNIGPTTDCTGSENW